MTCSSCEGLKNQPKTLTVTTGAVTHTIPDIWVMARVAVYTWQHVRYEEAVKMALDDWAEQCALEIGLAG